MKGKLKKMIIVTGVIAVLLALSVYLFVNQRSFGRLPRGERLERIMKSPHYRHGHFCNLDTTPHMTSHRGRIGILWDFVFGDRSHLYPTAPVPAIKTDLKNLPPHTNYMVWFGHSSYLLHLDGCNILVDPVFYDASPVSFVNKPFPGTQLYKPTDMPDIDLLVITHDHWDHLDYRTVTEMKDRIKKVICPLGVGEHLEYWGFDVSTLVELEWYQRGVLQPDSSFQVYCLPTRHFSGRGPVSNQTMWASYLLMTPSLNVYLSGDGGYGTHFAHIGEKYPPIDLAILENGQYSPNWRHIHLMPSLLGQAALDLRARYVYTVHHSKYALSHHKWDEPLENEQNAAARDSLNLIVSIIGQVVPLDSLAHNVSATPSPSLRSTPAPL